MAHHLTSEGLVLSERPEPPVPTDPLNSQDAAIWTGCYVAAEAFRLGASGYLLKRSAASELPSAVHEVMNQRYYITPLLTRDLVGSFVHAPEARKPIYQLTSRQREVLLLLAEGRSMKEAAAVLNVSPRTVAFHKYRMMEQLRVHSTAALIQFAVREGLI